VATANVEPMTIKSAAQETAGQGTCLVCKHPLIARLNIFHTRTKFSRTLVSVKLGRLVQNTFKEDASESDICVSCSSLVNQVDECETRLVALENEVKLKYKMPCALSVRGGDPSAHAQEMAPPLSAVQPDGMDLQGLPVAYLIEGGAVPAGMVDTGSDQLVVFRDPGDGGEEGAAEGEEGGMAAEEDQMFWSDLSLPQEVVVHEEATDFPEDKLLVKSGAVKRVKRRGAPSGKRVDKASRLAQLLRGEASPAKPRPLATPGNKFECRFCHQRLPSGPALHLHWNTDHPLELQPCPYCPKRFFHTSSLKQHIRTHQQLDHTCEECGRQFAAASDLRRHKKFRHSDIKRFSCPDCGVSFKLNWLMTRHRRRVHVDR